MPPLMPPPASQIGEAVGVVVAAVAALAHRRPAELAAPDHQRRVEQPAPFQVLQQTRDRLVALAAVQGVVALDVAVGVPLAAGAAVQLHEADAALDQPPRQKAIAADALRRLVVQAVELRRLLRLLRQVDRLRRRRPASDRPARTTAMRASRSLSLGAVGQVAAVQFLDEVELGPLPGRRLIRRADRDTEWASCRRGSGCPGRWPA